jgi:hypothetical protein
MYVREKKIRRGEKTYSYWQVVQNTRVDGKTRQTVVKHLGPLPDRTAAEVLARMWGVVCGAVGCGQEGVEEHAATVVKRGREVERTLLLCEEHAAALEAGDTLMSVGLDREWRHRARPRS